MADDASNNMRIWDAVSVTDPSVTKRVNQRGGFTAIAAHSQIMAATRQFGPIGEGWGYIAGEPLFVEGVVTVPVTIWHGDRKNTYGPLYGGAEWKSDKGRIDTDAIKKAETDALTKGLSQLGFNADVFLGKFDDNKYIEEVKEQFDAEREEETRAKSAAELKRTNVWQEYSAAISATKTLDELKDVFIAWWPKITSWKDSWQELAKDAKDEQKDAIIKADIEAEHVRSREAEFGMRDTFDAEEAAAAQ